MCLYFNDTTDKLKDKTTIVFALKHTKKKKKQLLIKGCIRSFDKSELYDNTVIDT